MSAPIRLRLSRGRGFNLQEVSRAANGLAAVKVARPSIFGNPFSVLPQRRPGLQFGGSRVMTRDHAFGGYIAVPTVEDAVACFREYVTLPGDRPDAVRAALPRLRGRNLACWCALDAPCHADVLLEMANRPTCEAAP